MMFVKIYFGNRPLYLCDNIDPEIAPFIHHDDGVFIDEFDSHSVKSMIHEMEKPTVHSGVFVHQDLEELTKAFWKKFTVIKAGGGIVRNQDQEVLIIFRRGKYDLPKGKLDRNETMEECAVREVTEETGVVNIELLGHFHTTYHTYHEGSKHVLKESHWYKMSADRHQQLVPQTEEGIGLVKWMNRNEVNLLLPDTFPSVADVLQKYFRVN